VEPRVTLPGLLRVRPTISSTSSALSPAMTMSKVLEVCPGLKVRVPLAAV